MRLGVARESTRARRIRPSSVRDWEKREVYPGSAPRRVKSLLPAFCIDMRVDYRGAASSWRVAPLESLDDVYDGIGRALMLPWVRFI